MRAPAAAAVAGAMVVASWVGWVGFTGALTHPLPETPRDTPRRGPIGYPWRGVVHVHTDLSADASGSLEQIVAAADDAGLDFIVVADHTQAQGSSTRVHPGWNGRVLVIVAEEVATDEGHLLALGVRAHPYALGPTFRQAARDIVDLGGEILIAHPVGGERPWTGGYAGVSGQEIVSLSSALQTLSPLRRLGAFLVYPASPAVAALRVLGRRPAGLDRWDERTRLEGNPRPVPQVGVGAVDAHGPLVLGVPSYAAAFRTVSTIVWMDEPPGSGTRGAARRLTDRILEGRAAVLLSAAAAAPGLTFLARGPAGEIVAPGAVARHRSGPWMAEITLDDPRNVRLELRRDGRVVATADGGKLESPLEVPGTYRVEAFRTAGPAGGGRPRATPWIVTNPIYLWPEAPAAAARSRPAPELPAPPERRSLLALPGWAAEDGGQSMSALGLQGDGLRWQLAMPAGMHAEPYAALAWRPQTPEDWRPHRGASVALRSERPWRVALRVWTRADGRTVTWEHIVSTGPDQRPVAVPWAWFRRVTASGRDPFERLDDELAAVEGVALVVTPQLMRSGSEAAIDIARLGLFGGSTSER